MKLPQFITGALAALFLLLGTHTYQVRAAATLLPNAEQCFSGTTGINGQLGTLGTITPGSGGTSGTYPNISLTGGSGSGATANIVVSGGGVTSVTILNPGTQYVVGDTLSAVVGGVSGFSVLVASTTINSSLAGGSVAFYIPNTSTPKQTWQNAAQTILNQNPVPLNSNGCAIIYGTGSYRQVVQDNLGNYVWDQITTDVSANNSTFWAGLAGGTPNAITVTDPGFNGTDGSIINFIALDTNTGATTINPSGFGPITVLKATTAGPVALTGGEIIAGNPISVIYSAAGGTFTLLNTVIQSASGAQAPLCGASGLKVTNGTTAASQIQITARNLVMVSASGLTINRSNVSLTLNITSGTSVTTPNGMDGESPGTSNWVNAFAIDNGAAPASLGTLSAGNGQAPVLPSGYSYQCYLGAMYVNSGGSLQGSIQLGNRAQWVVGGSGLTNGSTLVMANGVAGTYSASSPVLAAVPIAAFVPPTATTIKGMVTSHWENDTPSYVLVAPNASWGGTNNGPGGSNGVVWPVELALTAVPSALLSTQYFELDLETGAAGDIYWTSNANGAAISALGWTDAVNAN